MNGTMQFVLNNKAAILAGILLTLKWIYNAWTPGVTFSEFVRTLIGEIVQEAPNKLPALTPEQVKLLARAQVQKEIPVPSEHPLSITQ